MNQGTTAMSKKGAIGHPTTYTGLIDCGMKIMKHEGPIGFLRGFSG